MLQQKECILLGEARTSRLVKVPFSPFFRLELVLLESSPGVSRKFLRDHQHRQENQAPFKQGVRKCVS